MKNNLIKNILLLIFLTVFVGLSISLKSQSKKDLENEKKKTLNEIEYTNKLLDTTKNKEKESINKLTILNKKINNRKKLISQINKEVELTNERIANYELVISYMEEDLEYLSVSYANLIKSSWKNKNKQHALMFLLASNDVNQSYLRLKYIQQLSLIRKHQLLAIKSIKPLLEESKNKAKTEKELKEILLVEQEGAKKDLQYEQQEKQKTIVNLQNKGKDLEKKLKEQQQQLQKLNKQIEKLIAEEAAKATKNSKGEIELTPAEKTINKNFGNNKGNLGWPVERGIITSYFGSQPHPVLKNVTIDNKGIDIQTTEGSNALAIFEGEVTKVFSLPGMHKIVLIKHGEYFTVYTNLESAEVSEGSKVSSKQILGKIVTDKTENKTMLHFEIWYGSYTQNPSLWLAK
ncbi:MAG: peptidoglycan DD-metalloendopeptidase family protein [Bacteroidales bacterium]|jgi:septal ring factor EnvC (AmiA/AmiB activator)|nr:peptidoglycan DD-metalloendopeptidase family protein [Bacteroidales bacterium]